MSIKITTAIVAAEASRRKAAAREAVPFDHFHYASLDIAIRSEGRQ